MELGKCAGILGLALRATLANRALRTLKLRYKARGLDEEDVHDTGELVEYIPGVVVGGERKKEQRRRDLYGGAEKLAVSSVSVNTTKAAMSSPGPRAQDSDCQDV